MIETKRIQWIDQIRGVAILTVVLGHVLTFSLFQNLSWLSWSQSIFSLPSFMFVSGFLFYNTKIIKQRFSDLMKKKWLLLFPWISFGLIYSLIFNKDILNLFIGFYKNGYWFTFVLVEFFIVGYVSIILSEKFGKNSFLLKIAILISPYILIVFLMITDSIINEFVGVKHFFDLYIFFIIGILFKQYWSKISLFFLENYKFGVFSFFVYLLLTILIVYLFNSFSTTKLWLFLYFVIRIPAALGIVVFMIYTLNRINKKNIFILNKLSKIGERSIDIYVIHYFFLKLVPKSEVLINFAGINFFTLILTSFSISSVLLVLSYYTGILIRHNKTTSLVFLGSYR